MKLDLSTKTILIIEDYSVMRKAMKDMLYTLGTQYIFEAEDGFAAISAMKKQKFDIVLCDYNLRDGKNGQQILEEARYNKLLSLNALFIFVTAYQSANFVLGIIENKPDEYLAKPFNSQQLFRRIEKSYLRKQCLSVLTKEIDKENLASAIFHCNELLNGENRAIRSQLLKIRADLAINVGDFSTAMAIYQELLEQRDLFWARLGTGIVALFQNHVEQAICIFQKLIAQNPMLLESYDWLAKSYEAIERTTEAEDILNQAIEISPISLIRQKKLAVLADRTERLDIAEKAYLAVIDLGKHSVHKSPDDYSGLAKVYSKKNKPQEALNTLDDLRQQFANNPEAELRAATLETEIYQNIGDNEQSQLAFKKIRQLQGQLKNKIPKQVLLDIAKASYLNKDDKQADKIILSLIHNHIDDHSFLDDILQMLNNIGHDNDLNILIQRTRKELTAINNQGLKLFRQGKLQQAFTVFEQAIEITPNNKTIILNMAKITLRDLKASGVTEEKLLLADCYIKRAKQAGVTNDKVGKLQLEFEMIMNTPPLLI